MDPVTAMLTMQGVSMGISALLNRKGGMQKSEATRIVDSVEVELGRILATWQQLSPKTLEAKNQFLKVVLENFDKTKYFLLDPRLGEHGQRAVMERFGTFDPISGSGVRGTGGKGWEDWWTYYWFPIADSEVEESEAGAALGTNGNSGYVNSSNSGIDVRQLLVLGAVGVGVFFLMSGE